MSDEGDIVEEENCSGAGATADQAGVGVERAEQNREDIV